jgi:hypothetical protein
VLVQPIVTYFLSIIRDVAPKNSWIGVRAGPIEKDEGTSAIVGQVIVARAETSRSVTGIVDGLASRAIESEDDKQNRSKLLRDLDIQKMTRTCRFATRRPVREGPSVERTSDNPTCVLSAAGTRRRSRGSRQA